MKTWKIFTIEQSWALGYSETLSEQINAIEADGWTIVTVSANSNGYNVYVSAWRIDGADPDMSLAVQRVIQKAGE